VFIRQQGGKSTSREEQTHVALRIGGSANIGNG